MNIGSNLHADSVEQAGPVEPLCVEPQATIRQVFAQLRDQQASCVLVCREGILAGIFTERDALRLMAADNDLSAPIESVMSTSVVTLRSDSTVATAIRQMASGGYRRLPIVDPQGRPTGVLQVPGIVHYLVEHFPQTIYNLPPAPDQLMQQREGP